ncbi:hypothetical protein MMC34_005015 [Xylographa carneopallida]|nr:hypothetical protein [Xylographa carneopallida]
MRHINLLLISLGAYLSLSRHFAVAVFGNCIGCLRPSTSDEAPPNLFASGGVSVVAQNAYNAQSRAPRAFVGRNRVYGIYCGTRNTQIVGPLNAAINLVARILDDYWSPVYYPVRWAPFASVVQIFPIGPQFSAVIVPLNLFVRGMSIQVSIPGYPTGMTPRSVVCATPTMLNDYGIANSYYDICRQDPTIVAFHPARTATLMLCPSFFALPVHVEGRHCPKWNRFFQLFDKPYEPRTVEYQTYTLLRGFLDVTFDREENIVVSPNPGVPNWNELNALPPNRKRQTSALYQLYIACESIQIQDLPVLLLSPTVLDQKCPLSPQPPQDAFNQYIASLAKYYLGKLDAQNEAAVGEVMEEILNNVAGPSEYEVGEFSSAAAD